MPTMTRKEILDAYLAGKVVHFESWSDGRGEILYENELYILDIYDRIKITLGKVAGSDWESTLAFLQKDENGTIECSVHNTPDEFALDIYKGMKTTILRAIELSKMGFSIKSVRARPQDCYIPLEMGKRRENKLVSVIDVTSIANIELASVIDRWEIVGFAPDYVPFDLTSIPTVAIRSWEDYTKEIRDDA